MVVVITKPLCFLEVHQDGHEDLSGRVLVDVIMSVTEQRHCDLDPRIWQETRSMKTVRNALLVALAAACIPSQAQTVQVAL